MSISCKPNFLRSGYTIAVLQVLANIPCVSDRLMISVIICSIPSSDFLRRSAGTGSISQLFVGLDLITFLTSSDDMSTKLFS